MEGDVFPLANLKDNSHDTKANRSVWIGSISHLGYRKIYQKGSCVLFLGMFGQSIPTKSFIVGPSLTVTVIWDPQASISAL